VGQKSEREKGCKSAKPNGQDATRENVDNVELAWKGRSRLNTNKVLEKIDPFKTHLEEKKEPAWNSGQCTLENPMAALVREYN